MKRVVIAEDDQDILTLLESTLKFRGYQVLPASDGQQAWQLIQRERPDAAILDMNMPGLDGLEVCRRLRADPNTRHIGVIFLTARGELEDKVAAFKTGADDYLVKPFAPRELTVRLAAVIARTEGPKPAGPAAAPPGSVIALFGAKGGVGTSVLAANLAVALALGGGKVCLVDLDLDHAIASTLFDLIPRRQGTLADLSRGFEPGLDWESLEGYLLAHKSGVRLLPGPPNPIDAERVTGEQVKVYLDLIRQHHSYVVVDLFSSFREVVLETFGVSDRLLIVVTPELPALKAFRGVAEVLKQLSIPPNKVQVVVNQPVPTAGLSLADVKRAVGLPVIATVPYGGEELVDSVNEGAPLVLKRPQHATSLAIKKLAEALMAAMRPAGETAVR